MRSTSLITLVLGLTVGIGCTDNPPAAVDGGTQQDAAVTPDDAFVAPVVDANTDAYMPPIYVPHDAGYDDAGPAMAFTGATETWQGVTIEGSHCGNGSPMVIAVNLSSTSSDVVVFFQGGGACWDGATCFGLRTATHVQDTLTASTVITEAMGGTSFLFDRNAQNPYQNASYVYIPYCTGDGHTGTNVATLTYGSMTYTMHFEGARNSEFILERAAATWPSTTHVTLVGVSGGGYGVIGNWWRAQQIFASARVDALSDSGLPLDVPTARWRVMLAAWGLDLPPDCTGCDSLGDAMPYYAMTMPLPHRFGLLAYLHDTTIPMFYGEASVTAGLQALATQMATTTNQRYFYVDAADHVVLSDPTQTAGATGPTAQEWVTQFATDDPAWVSVGP